MLALKLNSEHRKHIKQTAREVYDGITFDTSDMYETVQGFQPKWVYVPLPEWAHDLGVKQKDGRACLLVDVASCQNPDHPQWNQTDWWAAAFHFLNGTFERMYEEKHGPTHSYSFRLKDPHPDLYEYAWVNRIFLFLVRMSDREYKTAKPSEFILTHDIDYISKTLPLILKKAGFDVLNFFKNLARGQVKKAGCILISSIKFAFTPYRYNYFEFIQNLENQNGYNSIFHFYGGKGVKKQSWLLDPSYCVDDIVEIAKSIKNKGGIIGLHPSYHCWENADCLKKQKHALEKVSGNITDVRQHWLRFSWEKTWAAQAIAGFKTDTTLMWNDRPGFRNGCAFAFKPLGVDGARIDITARPTVMMDSHFFDYADASPDERFEKAKRLIDEVRFVGGDVAILWHHRVFHPETNWGGLYKDILEYIMVDDGTDS